jgi:hypothetical protein
VQGIPHIASTPHDGRSSPVPPAREAQQRLPVFVDQSGWRRRTLQGLALAVGCACLGYLLFLGTLISGLWQPVGSQPPSTDRSQSDRSLPPPAGGLKQ